MASNTVPVAPIRDYSCSLDSLTAGYGLPEVDSYPSQLQKKLKEKGYNYQVQNAGISGDTSAGLLSRMDWLLASSDPSANTSEFSFAILCIGGNDAFQGKSLKISRKIFELLSKNSKQKKSRFSSLEWRLHSISGRIWEAIWGDISSPCKGIWSCIYGLLPWRGGTQSES